MTTLATVDEPCAIRFSKFDCRCSVCNRVLKYKNFPRHVREQHSSSEKLYKCPILGCKTETAQKSNLIKHITHVHEGRTYECKICGREYSSLDCVIRHQRSSKSRCVMSKTEQAASKHGKSKANVEKRATTKDEDSLGASYPGPRDNHTGISSYSTSEYRISRLPVTGDSSVGVKSMLEGNAQDLNSVVRTWPSRNPKNSTGVSLRHSPYSRALSRFHKVAVSNSRVPEKSNYGSPASTPGPWPLATSSNEGATLAPVSTFYLDYDPSQHGSGRSNSHNSEISSSNHSANELFSFSLSEFLPRSSSTNEITSFDDVYSWFSKESGSNGSFSDSFF